MWDIALLILTEEIKYNSDIIIIEKSKDNILLDKVLKVDEIFRANKVFNTETNKRAVVFM